MYETISTNERKRDELHEKCNKKKKRCRKNMYTCTIHIIIIYRNSKLSVIKGENNIPNSDDGVNRRRLHWLMRDFVIVILYPFVCGCICMCLQKNKKIKIHCGTDHMRCAIYIRYTIHAKTRHRHNQCYHQRCDRYARRMLWWCAKNVGSQIE